MRRGSIGVSAGHLAIMPSLTLQQTLRALPNHRKRLFSRGLQARRSREHEPSHRVSCRAVNRDPPVGIVMRSARRVGRTSPIPKRKRRTRRGSGRSRRRRMRRAIGRFGDCRRAPPSGARWCYCCARRGRGEGVGPTGTPVPNRRPKTKQHAGPEGRARFRFW